MWSCARPSLNSYGRLGCRCDACCELKAEADWRTRSKSRLQWQEDLAEPIRTVSNPYGTAHHVLRPHLNSRGRHSPQHSSTK